MAPSSTLLAAATAYFDVLSSHDADKISAILPENYTHTLGPEPFIRSIGITEPMGGAAFAPALVQQNAVFSDHSFKVKEAWPNEATNVVTAWVVAEGTLREEFVDAEAGTTADFYREYMFVLTVDANNKIEKVFEFVDTQSVKSLGVAQAKHASRS